MRRCAAKSLHVGVWLLAMLVLAPIPRFVLASEHVSSPIAGHWEADVEGDGRVFTFVFDFTTHGDTLGGKLRIAQREGEVPISGTLKGGKLHFEQFGLWNGTLVGATLKLTRGLDGGKVQHMTAYRVPKR